MQLVECVPNFSEGRDHSIIDSITQQISQTEGVKLLDVDPGADTNRTVVTFVGSPAGVKEAAFQAIKRASELIDMRQHSGAHPRMGATDVCPFVPVSGVTTEECVEIAKEVGARVAQELSIPVYLYEKAASRPERNSLSDIRKGEYEALEEKLKQAEWKPDFGESTFNARSGATVVGVREFLIAYNVNLNTMDGNAANEIAKRVRQGGKAKRDENGKIVRDEKGKIVRIPGSLDECRGVGWVIPEYEVAQVSMNLTNYKITPPHKAYEEIRKEAEDLGLLALGSEIVGLVPLEAVLEAGRFYLKKQGKNTGVPEKDLVKTAIQSLGLDSVSPFDPNKKIIEYQFRNKEDALIAMKIDDFVDELSSDSPAPGGGSVAALNAALSSGLSAMVASLTHGKKNYENVWEEMESLAVEAQKLKDMFLDKVDKDTEAFNRVMAAMKMKRKTPEQKEAREKAMESANKEAARVPFTVLEESVKALQHALKAAEKGNKNSLSDAGVAGLTGLAAAKGAFYNVLINLGSISDLQFKREFKQKSSELFEKARNLADQIESHLLKELS